MFAGRFTSRLAPLVASSSSSFSSSRPALCRLFASSSSYPPSTANNQGNYAANEVPISSTANPEPNRAPSSIASPFSSASTTSSSSSSSSSASPSTIKVRETLKDAYSGLKDRMNQAKQGITNTMEGGMNSATEKLSGMTERMANQMEGKASEWQEKMEKEGMDMNPSPMGMGGGATTASMGGGRTATAGEEEVPQDAAVGGEGVMKQGAGRDPVTQMMEEPTESGHVRLRSSSSSSSSSPTPPPSQSSLRPPSSSSSSSSSFRDPTLSDSPSADGVPNYGVSAKLKPVDSAAMGGVSGGGGEKSDMVRGSDRGEAMKEAGMDEEGNTATEQAAREQRAQGMTSSELLGTQNIKGKKEKVEKAQAPAPNRSRGASRSA